VTAPHDFHHGCADAKSVHAARAFDAKACEWLNLPRIEVPGPRIYAARSALRQAARQAPQRGAWALVARADCIYWDLALRHADRFVRYAHAHARRSNIDIDEVCGALREASYRCAIEWDPARAPFPAALREHMRTAWQRSPSRQSVVVMGSGTMYAMDKGFGRARVDHLEDLCERDGAGAVHDDVDSVDDVVHQQRLLHDLYRAADRIDPLARRVFDHLVSGESASEMARTVGVSRQRVSQVYLRMLRELRVEMGAEDNNCR